MIGTNSMAVMDWRQSENKELSLDKSQSIDRFLSSVERRAFQVAVIATKNQDDALDLVQDAMLKLVQKYSNKPESTWPPLFFRILQNRILDYHRRNTVRRRWQVWLSDRFADTDDFQEDPLSFIADDSQPGIEQQLSSGEDYQAAQQAIADLPLRQQQALILRAWEGLSVMDTAFVMQCSEGSVKTHYSRAVNALRKRLEA